MVWSLWLLSFVLGSAALPAPRAVELTVAGDRAVRVIHAAPEITHALVYLPGMCGDERGADAFAASAVRHGTIVTVRGDVKCPDRPGYKWPSDTANIQARIDRALELVRTERGGALDTTRVTLLGYSQGAHRAERLAAHSPYRYPTVFLGGPPGTAWPERFRHARRVAIAGGELENTGHMSAGYLALAERGITARFFVFPGAGHGSYGPEGDRVMNEVLTWLLAE